MGWAIVLHSDSKLGACSDDQAQARTSVAARYARLWAGGLLAASALIMVVSPYFVSSLKVYEWSPEIGDYVLQNGYVHRNRIEGWSTTRHGRFGLSGVTDVPGPATPTVLIWGDSFMEGHQVNDAEKAANQVTRALAQQGHDRIAARAVGQSWWSVADYYFNIPAYEKLLNPMCHFIVLADHGLKDICPDGERFLAVPTYRFVRHPTVDGQKSRLMRLLQKWRLQDVVMAPWKATRHVTKDLQQARFALGPAGARDAPEHHHGCQRLLSDTVDPNLIMGSWRYALDRLKSSTARPIVLVLVPEVAVLQEGKVCCENPQAQWSARLARLCREQRVGYVDMTETLVDDYRATGKLSRGFHNGRPGCGHLNARGHRLLADTICAYLRENFIHPRETSCAVHSD